MDVFKICVVNVVTWTEIRQRLTPGKNAVIGTIGQATYTSPPFPRRTAKFQLVSDFLNLMLDPAGGGGGGGGAGGGATSFAPEQDASLPPENALAYNSILTKAPPKPQDFDQRWSSWGSAFGGSANFNGNPGSPPTERQLLAIRCKLNSRGRASAAGLKRATASDCRPRMNAVAGASAGSLKIGVWPTRLTRHRGAAQSRCARWPNSDAAASHFRPGSGLHMQAGSWATYPHPAFLDLTRQRLADDHLRLESVEFGVMGSAGEYQNRARRCAGQAQMVSSAVDRARWRQLADQWMALSRMPLRKDDPAWHDKSAAVSANCHREQ